MYQTLIAPDQLAAHLDSDNWRIIDSRFSLADTGLGRRAFEKSHIPGAVYAHLDDDLSGPVIPGKTSRHPLPEVQTFAQILSGWGIDESVQVVAYDDAGGMIASRLWWMLRWLGHSKAAVLDGGFPAWLEAGFPVETESKMPPVRQFAADPQTHLLATLKEVENRPAQLVDSRAPERYRGELEPIDPVAGRIPGAINAFHGEVLDSRGRFLPPAKLRSHFKHRIKEGPEPIFYCGSGVSACRNILAMEHAGMGGARLYAGSWSEWITDPHRPVARGGNPDGR